MDMLGGKVERGKGTAEFGRAYITKGCNDLLLLKDWFQTGPEEVWMSHSDHVSAIPVGFEVFGTSPNAPFPNSPNIVYGRSPPNGSFEGDVVADVVGDE